MHSLFGTDGIRARVGVSPLTPTDMMHLGKVLGTWITQQHPNARIILGHDTRISAPLLKNALKAGLLHYPVTVCDVQVISTPALFYHTTQGDYEYGIMLTASHNAYTDNGIKIVTHHGGKLTEKEEQVITELFYGPPLSFSYENLGTETVWNEALASYCQALKEHFPADFLAGKTIVIDCAQGACASYAPQLLQTFGASVIPLAITPSGKNINHECGSLHPKKLQEAVSATGADVGFAFDGDGDRLIAVTNQGICKDGDELLGFLLRNPFYQPTKNVVGTVLSNQGLCNFVEAHTKTFHRTPVGDKHVIQKMKELQALIGGEPSGHLILRDFTDTADGLFTLLQIAYTAVLLADWSLESFTKLPQAVLNVPVTDKKDLSLQPYSSIIAAHQQELAQGRLIIRYSGTEPLLRIMVEASTYEEALHIGTTLSEKLSYEFAKE